MKTVKKDISTYILVHADAGLADESLPQNMWQ